MVIHDPTKEDFTLMEWILACQCFYINRIAGFKHHMVRVQRVLPILFEDIMPIVNKMSDVEPAVSWSKAEEALLNRGLAVAFPRCTVKALIQDHLMKLLYLSEEKFNVEGEPFEPNRVNLNAAVSVCTSAVCNILNELNVDQYHQTAAVSPLSPVAAMPTTPTATDTLMSPELQSSSLDAAWTILTDCSQHVDPDLLAAHLKEVGVKNPSNLMKCSRSAIDSIAVMLRPVPKEEFLPAVKKAWAEDAWAILNQDNQVKSKEVLAAVLRDEGIDNAKDLAEADQEILTQIMQCLKTTAMKKFKNAMRLE
jgi:hypothetical protein